MNERPLAIDLFSGMHGWAEGLVAAGFYVIGVDIEDMSRTLGEPKPEHFSLVLQDVRSLHGSQFKDAALIVASPPCQAYSYMSMPWSLAKARAAAIRADTTGEELRKLNELFDACFRIQREASEAAARHVPMVIENVRGAVPWVGRSRWNFGSYHLWGDVPALMPSTRRDQKFIMDDIKNGQRRHVEGCYENGLTVSGRKLPGFRFDGSGGSFQSASVAEHVKVASDAGGRRTDVGKGARFTSRDCGEEGRKHGGDWFSDPDCPSRQGGQKAPTKGWFNDSDDPNRMAAMPSASPRRKAASARIAKIPRTLAEWIGRCYMPETP